MWRVIHLPHTYLWPIYCVPGMVLSVRLSEFLVKLMDKGLPSGHFLRHTWLFVKTVLVTNWSVHFLLTKAFHGSSSLCFIFFCEKKKTKTDNLEWSKEMSLAESEGSVAFFQLCCKPALQPQAAQSVSLVLRFLSVRWRWDDSWHPFQLPGNCTHKVAFRWNLNKSVYQFMSLYFT